MKTADELCPIILEAGCSWVEQDDREALAANVREAIEARDARIAELEAERDQAVKEAIRLRDDLLTLSMFLEAQDTALARVAELERVLTLMLNSARPHPLEHPTMWEAWKAARATLEKP